MATAAASAPSTGPDVHLTHLAQGAGCGCKLSAVADVTTSGGLLVALPPERTRQRPGEVIGRMHEGEAGVIAVR